MAGDVAAGWTVFTDTTATFVVTFEAMACMPVVPVDAGCGPGDVYGWGGEAAAVTLPSTAGIVYSDRAGGSG